MVYIRYVRQNKLVKPNQPILVIDPGNREMLCSYEPKRASGSAQAVSTEKMCKYALEIKSFAQTYF